MSSLTINGGAQSPCFVPKEYEYGFCNQIRDVAVKCKSRYFAYSKTGGFAYSKYGVWVKVYFGVGKWHPLRCAKCNFRYHKS